MDDLKERRLEKSIEGLSGLASSMMETTNQLIEGLPHAEPFADELRELGYRRRPIFPIVCGFLVSLTGELLRQFDLETESANVRHQLGALWNAVSRLEDTPTLEDTQRCWALVVDATKKDEEDFSDAHRHELMIWMDHVVRALASMFETSEGFFDNGGFDLLLRICFKLYEL